MYYVCICICICICIYAYMYLCIYIYIYIYKEHFPGLLSAVVAETSRRMADFDAPSLMMLSDSLFDAGVL